MNQRFRKILVNLLMLAIIMLPMPSAFSMPMEKAAPASSDHCKQMMDHAGHDMAVSVTKDEQADKNSVTCKCCGQCDGDCMGCTTMSAITYELFRLNDITSRSVYNETLQSFNTRSTSPSSRPPLSL